MGKVVLPHSPLLSSHFLTSHLILVCILETEPDTVIIVFFKFIFISNIFYNGNPNQSDCFSLEPLTSRVIVTIITLIVTIKDTIGSHRST